MTTERIGAPSLALLIGWWATWLSSGSAWAQTRPESGTTEPPATIRAPLGNEQIQALVLSAQAKRLVDLARTVGGPPRLPRQTAEETPLWRLDRQIVLLEAARRINERVPISVFGAEPRLAETALRIEDEQAEACFDLYRLQKQLEGAYRRQSQQHLLDATKAQAAGQAQLAKDLDERATRALDLANAVRNAGVKVLRRYVQLAPADIAAWQWLIAEELEPLSVVKDRIDFLEGELAKVRQGAGSGPAGSQPAETVSAEKVSAILTMLANYHAGQGARQEAARLLKEAVREMPFNRQAALALIELKGPDATPAECLDFLLTGFQVNPTDPATVAAISSFLARYNLYEVRPSLGQGLLDRGALQFLAYERDLRRDLLPNQPLPPDLLLRHGLALAGSGKVDEGLKLMAEGVGQAMAVAARAADTAPDGLPPFALDAQILLAEAVADFKGLDKTPGPSSQGEAGLDAPKLAEPEPEARKIVDYYQANKDKTGLKDHPEALAWLSWFYLRALDDVATALDQARRAFQISPEEPIVRRALGAALVCGGDVAEAVKLLRPLAPNDPWSAWFLADALGKSKDPQEVKAAVEMLGRLASLWPGEQPGRLARQKLLSLGQRVPPTTDEAAMRDQLQRLSDGLFQFYQTPGRFASVRAVILSGDDPTEPLLAELRLVNRTDLPIDQGGPGVKPFDITLGAGSMVWPEILVSADVELAGEKAARSFRGYGHVRLAGPQALKPGQQIAVKQTLDVGPVGQLLALTPQGKKEVSVEFLVNPVESISGGWTAGPGGYSLGLKFTRKAFSPGNNNVLELYAKARGGDLVPKIKAVELLGSLLAEQQLAQARQLSYSPRGVYAYQLIGKLVEAAGDPDPAVRALWCDAVYPAGLTDPLRAAAVKHLSDPDGLVRLMAVWLLGDRVGSAMAKDISQPPGPQDDPLCRRLAQSYLGQWASKPAAK